MPSVRPVLVHCSFTKILDSYIEKGDKKLRGLVEDKLRILSLADNLSGHLVHLRQERAKWLYDIFLRVDLRKGGRRLFCLKWPVRTRNADVREIILPFFITSERDDVDYSDMRPYFPHAECICDAFRRGRQDEFQVWLYDGTRLVVKPLDVWPFLAHKSK